MAELKKSLGFWMIAAIAFLNLINTGIFFGASIGAQQAGLDSVFAWALLAILSIYIGMCFGELTSMFPVAGGVYEFAKQGYGRFFSFLIGWTVWVSGNIATALFTVAAVDYLYPFIDKSRLLAPALSFIYNYGITADQTKIGASILIVIALNYIAYRGIEASAKFMITLSVFMIGIIGAVIWTGAGSVQAAHLSGFTFHYGLIALSIFFLSETFFGWESASYMSEETEDAENVIPRALVTVTTFVAVVAVTLTLIIIGTIGIAATAAGGKPIIAMLTSLHMSTTFILVVNIGIVLAILGNASGNAVSLPRLLLAMSRDKLFIEQFSDIHPRRQTPYKAIIIQTIIAILIVLAGAGDYQTLLELLVPVSLMTYAATIILVPYFRFKRPDAKRPFKAPFGKWLPVFVAGFFALLLVYWALHEPNAISQLRTLASFLFFCVPIYLLLTYFYDPESLISTLSRFARINLWFENVLVPKRVRKEVIEFVTNPKDKHVMEFGSGVGSLTIQLAEQVGKNGKVYAVDLSEANVKIMHKRLNKLGYTQVEIIHDPHLVNRIHPSVRNVDVIVSINNLGYIQDVKKVLKEMNLALPSRGRVCFVEYVDLFYFLPNPKWLSSPEAVKQAFAQAGFTVNVKVRRGIFWKYMYIYGIKSTSDVPFI